MQFNKDGCQREEGSKLKMRRKQGDIWHRRESSKWTRHTLVPISLQRHIVYLEKLNFFDSTPNG